MQKGLTLISFLSQINPIHTLTFRICTTGPQPLPKEVLHIGKSSPSYFNFQYPLVSLRASSSCLPLLPRLPVTRSFYLPFNNVFYKAVRTQGVTSFVYIYIYSVVPRFESEVGNVVVCCPELRSMSDGRNVNVARLHD